MIGAKVMQGNRWFNPEGKCPKCGVRLNGLGEHMCDDFRPFMWSIIAFAFVMVALAYTGNKAGEWILAAIQGETVEEHAEKKGGH